MTELGPLYKIKRALLDAGIPCAIYRRELLRIGPGGRLTVVAVGENGRLHVRRSGALKKCSGSTWRTPSDVITSLTRT